MGPPRATRLDRAPREPDPGVGRLADEAEGERRALRRVVAVVAGDAREIVEHHLRRHDRLG